VPGASSSTPRSPAPTPRRGSTTTRATMMRFAWASTPPRSTGAPARRSMRGTISAATSAGGSSTWSLLGRDVGSGQPAVDEERRGGDVGGLVARQEDGRLRDLARLGEAAHRKVDEATCRLFWVAREQVLQQRRPHR